MIDDYDESSGWMFLLVPAHPGFPGQIPQSRKTVVCVCVCKAMDKQQQFWRAMSTCPHVHILEIWSWCKWNNKSTPYCLQCFDTVNLAQKKHPACKNWANGMVCIWFSLCHCHQLFPAELPTSEKLYRQQASFFYREILVKLSNGDFLFRYSIWAPSNWVSRIHILKFSICIWDTQIE